MWLSNYCARSHLFVQLLETHKPMRMKELQLLLNGASFHRWSDNVVDERIDVSGIIENPNIRFILVLCAGGTAIGNYVSKQHCCLGSYFSIMPEFFFIYKPSAIYGGDDLRNRSLQIIKPSALWLGSWTETTNSGDFSLDSDRIKLSSVSRESWGLASCITISLFYFSVVHNAV